MKLELLKKRAESTFSKRRMFKDLFTPWFILKNSLILNYYKLFKKGKAPLPIHIDIKLTNRCNGNCYFCYSKNTKKSKKELTTEEWKSFIRSFGNKKKAFYITGGEPFLRNDIFEIIKTIKKQGSYCGVVTNGTLISKKNIKKLLDLEIDNIVFSLHGLKENHNKILGISEAFENVTKAISELSSLRKKNKIKKPYIMMNYVINPNLINEGEKIINLCKKLGVDEIRFAHPSFLYPEELRNHNKISSMKFGFEICSNQFITNDINFKSKDIPTLRITKEIRINTYPNLDNKEISIWYKKPFKTRRDCFYLYTSCFINESGEVYPCHFYPISMGNIKKEKFENIWNGAKFIKLRRIISNSLLPGCSRCCKLF
jgi:Fe-coproporphyrin III synthase